MKKYAKYICIIIAIIIMVVIDQIVKLRVLNLENSIVVLPGILNITLVKNYGAVFGLAQGANSILAVVTLIICVAMLATIIAFIKKGKDVSYFLYLILAGGIGNIIDRFFRGYVVDFIDTPFIATFNIADALIVIGAFGFAIEYIVKSSKEEKNK